MRGGGEGQRPKAASPRRARPPVRHGTRVPREAGGERPPDDAGVQAHKVQKGRQEEDD